MALGDRSVTWGGQIETSLRDLDERLRLSAGEIRDALGLPATKAIGPVASSGLPEAEAELRRGRYYTDVYNETHDPTTLFQAQKALTRALSLDPGLAGAAVALGWLAIFEIEAGAARDVKLAEVKGWIDRAIAIKRGDACAYALSVAKDGYANTEPVTLLRVNLDALRLGAGSCEEGPVPGTFPLAWGLSRAGAYRLSYVVVEEVARQHPLYYYARNLAWSTDVDLGRARTGQPHLDAMRAMAPEAPFTRFNLAWASALGLLEPAPENARAVDEDVAAGRLPLDHSIKLKLAGSLRVRDAPSYARAHAEALALVVDPTTAEDRIFDMLAMAPIMVRYGKSDDALELMKLCAARDVVVSYDVLDLNPHFGPLRDDPRFVAIRRRALGEYRKVIDLLKEAREKGALPDLLVVPLEAEIARLAREAA